MWKKFTNKVKRQLVKDKFHKFNHGGYEYNISYNLIKDGRKNKIFNKKIYIQIQITLFHGKKDNVVPIIFSKKIMKIFPIAKKKLLIIKNGDHSLSRKSDLKKICNELDRMISKIKTKIYWIISLIT